jgi:hypothetical protein
MLVVLPREPATRARRRRRRRSGGRCRWCQPDRRAAGDEPGVGPPRGSFPANRPTRALPSSRRRKIRARDWLLDAGAITPATDRLSPRRSCVVWALWQVGRGPNPGCRSAAHQRSDRGQAGLGRPVPRCSAPTSANHASAHRTSRLHRLTQRASAGPAQVSAFEKRGVMDCTVQFREPFNRSRCCRSTARPCDRRSQRWRAGRT